MKRISRKNYQGPAIQIEGLHKYFGDFKALNDLSLEVNRGEIFGFLGLNGAGKTTTIKTLLALLRPTFGKVSMLGEEVSAGKYSLWDKIGYMEEACFYPDLSVTENIDIARRMQGLAEKGAVNRVIDQLGLEPHKNKKARYLSLGNKQRLGLAKALIHKPEILILDEPINGLDPAGVFEIRTMLLDLATNHGVTIFISSHLIEELSKVATCLGIIHNGHLVQKLTMNNLEQTLEKKLILDARNRDGLKRVLRAMGYTFDELPEGTLAVSDSRAIDAPDHLAKLLVAAEQAPTLLQKVTENLEHYFLRTIRLAGERAS